MKKTIFMLMTAFLGTAVFAQGDIAPADKYVKAMEALVPAVDTTHSLDGLTDLANSFERIANAEKTQWLPYYYAALCQINKANMYYTTQQPDKIDPLVDLAEPMLKKAEELSKNNTEIFCLKKMFNTSKMMADPMNRYMIYAPAAAEALEEAKRLDPENPRVYLLEGIDKYYTPEQYGGSKEEAKKLFEEAAQKFEAFKPASSIHPTWGMGQVKYFRTLD
jgi:tetratricopeptide (TPR) repeat protein